MAERMLVLVGHPDDESFSMGAMIAALTAAGHAVHVVALADGVFSRSEATTDDARRRSEHFASACQTLGATHQIDVVFPDQEADTVCQRIINRAVARQIAAFRPSHVYTHHPGDLNLDHRCVAEAVFVAARGNVFRLFCMTPEWPSLCVGPRWEPNLHIPIGRHMDTKVKACLCYEDELRPYPHPRSERAIRERPTESFMVVQ